MPTECCVRDPCLAVGPSDTLLSQGCCVAMHSAKLRFKGPGPYTMRGRSSLVSAGRGNYTRRYSGGRATQQGVG